MAAVPPGSSARVKPKRQLLIVGRVRTGWARLTSFPFAAAIALVGVNSGINFFVSPGSSVTHALLSPWDFVWAAFYGLGGLAILAGIMFQRADVEAAGCVAFAGGAAVNALTWAVVGGLHVWNTVVILAVFGVAGIIRAYHIYRGRVLLLVDVSEDGQPPHIMAPPH